MTEKRKPLLGEICFLNNDHTQLYTYAGESKFDEIPKPSEIIEETDDYVITKSYKSKTVDFITANVQPDVTVIGASYGESTRREQAWLE